MDDAKTESVHVVPATPEDFDSILAMTQAMQAESPAYFGAGGFNPAKGLQFCHNVHAKARTGDACMLLATVNGEPVGFAMCLTTKQFFNDERYAVDLASYVKPEHRQDGVLGQIVRHLEAWAAEQGVAGLNLEISTEAAAAGAGAACERLGYELSGYLLVKSLGASHG